jgi:hypothetical protein
MICKPPSWFASGLFFLSMAGSFFGFSALIPGVRHQMASASSLFWSFSAPWSLGACAVLALGARLIPAAMARRRAS